MSTKDGADIKPEEAQSIVAYLQRVGVLDAETIEMALREEPTQDIKTICDLLHGLMCKDAHDKTCEGFCTYLEEDEDWSAKAHQVWLAKADETFKHFVPTRLVHELIPIMQRAVKLSGYIQAAAVDDPKAYKMLLFLRGWEE